MRFLRPLLPTFWLAVLLFPIATVQAQDGAMNGKGLDKVILNLAGEGWATTQSATVHVGVEAVLEGAETGQIRTEVEAALQAISSTDKWQVVRFNQDADSSGLERWHINAEARLDEGELGGLRDKAKNASKPGLKVSVDHIDFTPTLAERQATLARLRAEIYADVQTELARLNAVYPDKNYRVHLVDFLNSTPRPVTALRSRMTAEAQGDRGAAAQPSAPVAVSNRLYISATVVLAAEATDAQPQKQ